MNLRASASVRICVVTYRRPHLLERALRSLLEQTRGDWTAQVFNDDPEDPRPAALVARLADPRISLATLPRRRGAAANFNEAFRSTPEPFASLLEDDNWWAPDFLETLVAALERHPDVHVACANERIWREQADGSWIDTGRTIWPVSPDPVEFPFRLLDKCGSARICNSALLFRTRHADTWRTPDDLPVDVTEHVRERILPHPILLIPRPLVHYAETLQTHRARGPGLWSEFQVLLIGSVFELVAPTLRDTLSAALWDDVRRHRPQSATSLICTGLALSSARPLLRFAQPAELARFALTAVRRPRATLQALRAPSRRASAWRFLLRCPLPSDQVSPVSSH